MKQPLQVLQVFVSNFPPGTSRYVIEKGAFAALHNLVEAIIYPNALFALGSLNSPLQKLTITSYEMSLTGINKITLQLLEKFNSTLSYLTIKYQSLLQRIEDDSFIWMQYLVTVNLDHNQINYLAQYAFNGLITLHTLNLASNDLKVVPSSALEVFSTYKSLRYLDLSSNSILAHIKPNAFSALSSSLTVLNLSLKKSVVKITSLSWIHKLHNLSRLFLESIDDKILLQEVSKHSLLELHVINFNVYFSPCIAFPTLETLTMVNNFVESFPADLALHKCYNLREMSLKGFQRFINSFDVEHLNITFPFLHALEITESKIISFFPILSIKAPKLTTLNISDNLIKTIDSTIGEVFPNLIHLDISNNAIVSLSSLNELKSIQYLNATGNLITVVPPWLLPHLKILDLSNNPFACSCDIESFKNWILSDNVTWLSPGEYVCASPKKLKGISITAIDLDCRSHTALYLGVSISSALVLCICIFLIIHYRWHIKYKLFLLYRNYYPFPENNNNMEFELFHLQYHAYVSYNEESRIDDDWVMNNLQPNMEEGPEPLQLCIKRRDFIPGQSLIKSIGENIQRSRKTILVLSPHFVESQWCYHEMEMAQMRLLDEHLDVLVLVLLQEIPNDKITLSLRKLLCKKEYLKWPNNRAGQRLFWQRLKQELKSPVQVDHRFH